MKLAPPLVLPPLRYGMLRGLQMLAHFGGGRLRRGMDFYADMLSSQSNRREEESLLGEFGGAGFADDGDLDLTGILHALFDLLGDVASQAGGG